MQFRETFQPITFRGQKNQFKGSMLKITFQSFKDCVHSEYTYQMPLTLQCEVMAPQGIISIDCNFPFHWLWFSLQSCGLAYILSYTKVVAFLCETSTIFWLKPL